MTEYAWTWVNPATQTNPYVGTTKTTLYGKTGSNLISSTDQWIGAYGNLKETGAEAADVGGAAGRASFAAGAGVGGWVRANFGAAARSSGASACDGVVVVEPVRGLKGMGSTVRAISLSYKWPYNCEMGQITIYLEDDLLSQVKAVTKAAGVSQSQWIAEAVRGRMRKEWPVAVRALAGAWVDFPSAEEIRKQHAPDSPRESF
jgi:hypothetical protein